MCTKRTSHWKKPGCDGESESAFTVHWVTSFWSEGSSVFPSQFDIVNVSDCTAYSAAVETDYLNLHEASIFTFLPVSVLVMSLCVTQRCTPTSNDLLFRNAFNSHSKFNIYYVWASLWRMMYVQSLTVDGYYHICCGNIHCLCVRGSRILRGRPTGMICVITNSLEASSGRPVGMASMTFILGGGGEGVGVACRKRLACQSQQFEALFKHV